MSKLTRFLNSIGLYSEQQLKERLQECAEAKEDIKKLQKRNADLGKEINRYRSHWLTAYYMLGPNGKEWFRSVSEKDGKPRSLYLHYDFSDEAYGEDSGEKVAESVLNTHIAVGKGHVRPLNLD